MSILSFPVFRKRDAAEDGSFDVDDVAHVLTAARAIGFADLVSPSFGLNVHGTASLSLQVTNDFGLSGRTGSSSLFTIAQVGNVDTN
jgi:hypothetical protein